MGNKKKKSTNGRYRIVKLQTNKTSENKKHMYTKMAVFCVTLLVLFIGISYGFLSSLNVGKKVTEVVSGTLVIEYEDSNIINIVNASPLTDEEGMKSTSYVFTIKNTGTLDGKYNVSLEEKDGNTLDKRYIKYSIQENGGAWSTPAYLNTGLILTSNKIITSGSETTYQIKMWLDENAGNEVQGQKYDAKVVINTVQTNAELKDIENPIIVLNGNTTVQIEQNEPYVDLGVSKVTDKNDISVTSVTTRYEYFDGVNTIPVEKIDTTKTGIYYIYYEVTDKEGNKGTSVRTINVYKKDSSIPSISLIGDETITLKYGQVYQELGAQAIDEDEGNISSNIITLGKVNENAPGIYIIKYVITDKSGNTSSVTREVIVLSKQGNLDIELKQDNTDNTKTQIDVSNIENKEELKYAITTTKNKPLNSQFKTYEELQKDGIISEDGKIELTENGTYYVWIKDEKGNIKHQEVTVSNIDETTPTCSFETVEYIGLNLSRDITLTCTDVADMTEKVLIEKNFKLSNDNAKIVSISVPRRVENGYKYVITIQGISGGKFNLTLPKGTLTDKARNENLEVTSDDTFNALYECAEKILEGVHSILEETPPELVADISERGIYITGGGGMVWGLDKLISEKTGIPVMIAEDPQSCVAIGTGKALNHVELFETGNAVKIKKF